MLCTDVIFDHVLPKASIDTRLAFRIPPRKLDMAAFEEALAGLSWKHGPTPARIHSQDRWWKYVPLWQFGKHDDGFPKSYFFICLDTNIYSSVGRDISIRSPPCSLRGF